MRDMPEIIPSSLYCAFVYALPVSHIHRAYSYDVLYPQEMTSEHILDRISHAHWTMAQVRNQES